ncbi:MULTISPECIES: RHS repeat-associated core domain-containing protein [unclassified Pseudomonas]|uniref:RHS repeat-associated core domain-containing protein n=1 Tax=unclassified Pseudomonas TaxID=196821 RepID=UPI00211530BD|nr:MULTISPECIES: RHS repeat-associated core domain-containing protein [unclassified Pseudomonas]
MTRSRPDDVHSRQSQTILLAADDKHSILAEVSESQTRSIAYSAYGQQSTQQIIATKLGFNGELREARLGWYFLGKGYRVYNPVLMRFHSPDSLSPFGKGGLNAYMYCMGDPVNFSDPTGHFFEKIKSFFSLRRASSTPNLHHLASPARHVRGRSNSYVLHRPSPSTPTSTSTSTPTPTTSSPHTPIPTQPPPRLNREVPPRPSKRKPLNDSYRQPHVNDTGGQVSNIAAGELERYDLVWKSQPFEFHDTGGQVSIIAAGELERYDLFWKSQPFEFPPAPFPRTTREGTREYRVKYKSGITTHSSFIKPLLPLKNSDIRS